MSRTLPDRPNLEFLKKEAKDHLDRLRSTDPSAQLSDAQHALSVEYGFASWPKLKAHVDAIEATLGDRQAPSASAVSPIAGRWLADVARSKRHPANQFQRATIEFRVSDDRVLVTNEVVDEAGKLVRGQHTLQADGVEHPFTNGYALTASWRGPRTLETVATQHGQVVGRGSYTVSEDGQHLTITDENQVIVLDRQP
jgi:hypothetical protein